MNRVHRNRATQRRVVLQLSGGLLERLFAFPPVSTWPTRPRLTAWIQSRSLAGKVLLVRQPAEQSSSQT